MDPDDLGQTVADSGDRGAGGVVERGDDESPLRQQTWVASSTGWRVVRRESVSASKLLGLATPLVMGIVGKQAMSQNLVRARTDRLPG